MEKILVGFHKNIKVLFFGLGSGEEHAAIHHSDYDFPDELICTSLKMFKGILTEILDA